MGWWDCFFYKPPKFPKLTKISKFHHLLSLIPERNPGNLSDIAELLCSDLQQFFVLGKKKANNLRYLLVKKMMCDRYILINTHHYIFIHILSHQHFLRLLLKLIAVPTRLAFHVLPYFFAINSNASSSASQQPTELAAQA